MGVQGCGRLGRGGAATNNTIYRWMWMDRMERGWTDGRQGQHEQHGGMPARCKAVTGTPLGLSEGSLLSSIGAHPMVAGLR